MFEQARKLNALGGAYCVRIESGSYYSLQNQVQSVEIV